MIALPAAYAFGLLRVPPIYAEGKLTAALVQTQLADDPFSGQLFVFRGRHGDRIKILWWSRNGFVLWYKVIEGPERFHWPRLLEEDVVSLTPEQLGWLLEGYDVWAQPHRTLKFSHAS